MCWCLLLQGEDYAAYVVNVAVNAQSRGQGIGFQLLLGAADFAAQHWQAQQMYTQVENWNEVGGYVLQFAWHTWASVQTLLYVGVGLLQQHQDGCVAHCAGMRLLACHGAGFRLPCP